VNTLEADEVALLGKERRWGFWNRRDITDGKTVYMRRISLVTTPWFSIKLHRIYRPDGQRELHDHPWSFFSIVLRGWYEEDVPHRCNYGDCFFELCPTRRKVRWWNWKRAEDRHSIRFVSRTPVWTLVFCAPARRVWGFWTDSGTKFIPWNQYEKLNDA